MYQIMLVAKEGGSIIASTYKFYLEQDPETGKYHVWEAKTLDEANDKVNELLNEENYARFNIMLIQQIKFNVYTDLVLPSV